jgi:hypothetical protein
MGGPFGIGWRWGRRRKSEATGILGRSIGCGRNIFGKSDTPKNNPAIHFQVEIFKRPLFATTLSIGYSSPIST